MKLFFVSFSSNDFCSHPFDDNNDVKNDEEDDDDDGNTDCDDNDDHEGGINDDDDDDDINYQDDHDATDGHSLVITNLISVASTRSLRGFPETSSRPLTQSRKLDLSG